MLRRQQLNLEYKLQPPSSRVTALTVSDFRRQGQSSQTPGWTSLLPNQLHCQENVNENQRTKQSRIFQKLNRLDTVDLANSNYSKLRVPSTGSRVSIKERSQLYTMAESRENIQNQQIENQRLSLRDHKSKTILMTNIKTNQSLRQSEITSKHRRSGTIVKNQTPRPKQKSKEKRFKHITVHDHLYIEAKRLETKRVMEQVLDHQYKKQHILTFRPQISQKSQELATIRQGKVKEKEVIQNQLIKEIESLSVKTASQTTREDYHIHREEEKGKVINKLFYILSQHKSIISKSTLKAIQEKLPLVCIQLLEKIIQKIYQGKQFTFLEFLGAVNDKKIVRNRQSLIAVTQKWIGRHENRLKDVSTKDDTHPHF